MSAPNPFEQDWLPDDAGDAVWRGETLPLADGPDDDPTGSLASLIDHSATDSPIGPIRNDATLHKDVRLYIKYSEGWSAHIKQDWMKEYCYSQNPGEEYYHLLLSGEIYLQRGTEKFCLNCALRHGHATLDRIYWQRSGARPRDENQS